ncbi:uncharacterized protein HMPREF1120_00932 [Exophiala dermatitidis NIH/UT8656]|uniref:Uncharacterized protein n=1 Tax=Exophiala dermatitidis (strain ATCC 34100 / CBS 525.76 / NIH/UT8656) TaxID=858893 RepID=H6BKT9_EXODN|nr:uncharacterized protein HMPREF1120_00932 [Exophiala dermatitidis NIH/UT8656]EHY52723.1 hypothetical protein HMPREF1120_00932 [Exophiala dermatitidis NIH/UT8656]
MQSRNLETSRLHGCTGGQEKLDLVSGLFRWASKGYPGPSAIGGSDVRVSAGRGAWTKGFVGAGCECSGNLKSMFKLSTGAGHTVRPSPDVPRRVESAKQGLWMDNTT